MAKGKIVDYRTALGRVVKEMAKDCKALVEKAIATKEFQNRTGNLQDSYGAAVYFNGNLLRETIYYREPIAVEQKKNEDGNLTTGHQEMIKYLERYRPRKKGLTIILVAAMYYGKILESGGGYLRHKYKVIIGANSLMRELAAKYDGMFGRRRGERTTINVERVSQ